MLSEQPTLATNGTPYMASGSMGGDAQPQIHVQLLSAMIDFRLNAQQAISAPRWRSGRFTLESVGSSAIEKGGQSNVDEHLSKTIAEAVVLKQRFPDHVPPALTLLGHRTFIHGAWKDGMGHAQAIVINPDTPSLNGLPIHTMMASRLVGSRLLVARVLRSKEGYTV